MCFTSSLKFGEQPHIEYFSKNGVDKPCSIWAELCIQFYVLCFKPFQDREEQSLDTSPSRTSNFELKNGADERYRSVHPILVLCFTHYQERESYSFGTSPHFETFPPKMLSINCASNVSFCATPLPSCVNFLEILYFFAQLIF